MGPTPQNKKKEGLKKIKKLKLIKINIINKNKNDLIKLIIN